jgi:hypothetical protein
VHIRYHGTWLVPGGTWLLPSGPTIVLRFTPLSCSLDVTMLLIKRFINKATTFKY